MDNGEDNIAIIMAILAMSRSLKLMVLAEGVETVEQMMMLKVLGCDAYQGFLKSKPVPADQLELMFLQS